MGIEGLRKLAEEAPDQKFIYIDGAGDEWFAFDAIYEIDGSEFCFRIWARDFPDADRRLAALKINAKIDGQVYAEFSDDGLAQKIANNKRKS